jgi:hypothetical protein
MLGRKAAGGGAHGGAPREGLVSAAQARAVLYEDTRGVGSRLHLLALSTRPVGFSEMDTEAIRLSGVLDNGIVRKMRGLDHTSL